MTALFVELDEARNPITTYIRHEDGRIDLIKDKLETGPRAIGKRIMNAFLPAGYPISVTPDYTGYQIYDSLQAFSSSIAGLLSSRAVLEGIGVGDSHASPTAALLLSVLQESMGRIATILFAHRLGTALEPECKMYRLAADIFNDAAMILDCLSPALPRTYRVVLLSASSVLRSLCGVAAGSAKASLSAHFATQGNLGELNAKDSSQETVISLLGMLVGTLVVSRISSQWATWTALIVLLGVHLGTNYLAVRAVSMRTLNRQRANLLFSMYLQDTGESVGCHKRAVPSPTQISARERIFEREGVLRWQGGSVLGYCEIGVPFSRILNSIDGEHLTTLWDEFKDDAYITWYDELSKTYLVTLKDFATPLDQLHAWMHALYLAYESKHAESNMVQVRSILREFSPSFLDEQLSQAGWDIETGALEVKSGTRLQIKSKQV